MVIEETLVDRDAEVPKVDHLGGFNVDLVHIDITLAVCLHGEFVEDASGSLIDAEDHNFVDYLGGGLAVQVLVADRFCHSDQLAIIFIADLSSLVVAVVVILTIIEIKVAGGEWVLAHDVGVDLETDRCLNSLHEGLSGVGEVEDWEDSATSHEGALLGVTDVSNMDGVLSVQF